MFRSKINHSMPNSYALIGAAILRYLFDMQDHLRTCFDNRKSVVDRAVACGMYADDMNGTNRACTLDGSHIVAMRTTANLFNKSNSVP